MRVNEKHLFSGHEIIENQVWLLLHKKCWKSLVCRLVVLKLFFNSGTFKKTIVGTWRNFILFSILYYQKQITENSIDVLCYIPDSQNPCNSCVEPLGSAEYILEPLLYVLSWKG